MARTALTVLLLLLAAASAKAGIPANPEAAWKEYLATANGLEPRYAFPYADCFRRAAANYELPETLLLAVARGESDFDAMARSKANAHGIMQILWPDTARHLGIFKLSDLYDPCINIDAGARYLREMLDRFDGDVHLALAAYNYGPGRIEASVAAIPSGARWYSGYIYRHLNYVIGESNRPATTNRSLYSELGRTTLVEFAEPYRAEAFVENLEAAAPGISLDWFRKGVGRFRVILSYESKEQFEHSASALRRAGFPLR